MKYVLMILWGAATASGWWAGAMWGFGNIFEVTFITGMSTAVMIIWVIAKGISEIDD